MDAVLGNDDEEEEAPNRMQMLAGGKPAWMCAALSMVVPAINVAGEWIGAMENAQVEDEITKRYGALKVEEPPELRGRLAAVRLAGIAKPQPLLVSLYLPVTGGSETQQDAPWIIAGDFNKRRECMDGLAIDRMWNARFVSAHGPTCGEHEIDYYCMHTALLPRIMAIYVNDDKVLRPHAPVWMELAGQGKFSRTIQKVAVPTLPHQKLCGPLKAWPHPEVTFEEEGDVTEQWQKWAFDAMKYAHETWPDMGKATKASLRRGEGPIYRVMPIQDAIQADTYKEASETRMCWLLSKKRQA
eukprot:6489619-Amphidinium_carterae.4